MGKSLSPVLPKHPLDRGIGPGPDGGVWYKLHDELNEAEYYVQAEHLRTVDPTELTPISSDVPDAKKRIEVNLGTQTLTAYEDTKVVLQTKDILRHAE